jgi:hypothetical protein
VRKYPFGLIGGFALVTLLGSLPMQIPSVLLLTGVIAANSTVYWALSGVCFVLSLLLHSFLLVGEVRVALAVLRDDIFDFSLFFSGGERAVTMLLAIVVAVIAAFFGFLFLLVPGVIIGLKLALTIYLVGDTEDSPIEALSESWEAMRGHAFHLWLFYVLIVVFMIGVIVVTFLFVPALLGSFVAVAIFGVLFYVGLLAAVPVLFVAFADVYRRVTGRMGGEGQ